LWYGGHNRNLAEFAVVAIPTNTGTYGKSRTHGCGLGADKIQEAA